MKENFKVVRPQVLAWGCLLSLSNLSHPTVKAFEEGFTFDATGNWTNFKQDTDGNGTWDLNQARTHNAANEIATISGSATNIATDRNGNMTKMPKPDDWSAAFTAVYDAWNRMVQVKNGSSTVATYGYNALNHRVVKKTYENGSLSETRLFYFNQNWQCLEERVGTATTVDITYTWGLRYVDDLICRDRGGERLYSLADPNWNVVALVDATGVVQERYNYSAFGKANVTSRTYVFRTTSAYGWTRTFTGQILDADSGLMLYRNRFYHAELGRFVSCDETGYDSGDMNLYRYVANRVAVGVDPDGAALIILIGIVIVAVVVVSSSGCTRNNTGTTNRAQNQNGICAVTVEKDCTIVILFGHGHSSTPHTVDFGTTNNTYATFVGCYPGVVNSQIPPEHLLPNSSTSMETQIRGVPNEGYDKLKKDAMEAAKKKADDLIQSGCCTSVTIQTVRVGVQTDLDSWQWGPQETITVP